MLKRQAAETRLVVVCGGSSTGKTRAACEAVTLGRLAGRWLTYLQREADLTARLDDISPESDR